MPASRPQSLPPKTLANLLDEAKRALQRGDATAAENLLARADASNPNDAEILRLLAAARGIMGLHADALTLLTRASALRPNDALIYNSLGNALRRVGDKTGACAAFERATQLAPNLAPVWHNYGKALSEDQRSEESLPVLARAIELAPDILRTRFLLAHGLRVSGRSDESAAEYRRILEMNPHNAEAWLGLAQLTNVTFTDSDIHAMRATANDSSLNEDDQISIRFALARALEDAGSVEESFGWLVQGNARVRRWYPWDAKRFTQRIDEFLAAFTPPPPPSAAMQGSEVIFIVSMPRSGSSLTEQILASHGDVDGAGELSDLPAVLQEEEQRRGKGFGQWAGDATPQDWQRLGARYLERTTRWRERHPRFTDKLPDNWNLIGAIAAMLPGARIVSCRRDPLETCLACFRQLFTRGGQAFSYDLNDIAAYWRDFDRADRQWRAQYPDQIYSQRYEALLADPETQVRALLDFCGLPFDSACLKFYETQRSVRTASATQVREPLRRDTARAEKYGALLDPLRAALGSLADDIERFKIS
jgi:tetratricopeptide (TPR) repeat protein